LGSRRFKAPALAVVSTGNNRNRGVSFFLGLKGQSEDRSIAGNARGSGGLFGSDSENARQRIIALRKNNLLAVFNQESAFADAFELQEIGIVVDLYGHRRNVRAAREHRI